MMKTYQYGNTIRLECEFRDFDNIEIDPTIVKVTIYDERHRIILESNGIKISTGKYYYDYITEHKHSRFIYEWYGEIDGKPALRRGQFVTKFI